MRNKCMTDDQGPAHPIIEQKILSDGLVRIKAVRHQRSYGHEAVPPLDSDSRYYRDTVDPVDLQNERYYPTCEWDIDEAGSIDIKKEG